MLNDFTTIDAVTRVMQEKRVNRDFFTDKEFYQFIEKLKNNRNWGEARAYIDLLKTQKARDLEFSIISMVVGQFIDRDIESISYDEAYEMVVEVETAWYSPLSKNYEYVSVFAFDYLRGLVK